MILKSSCLLLGGGRGSRIGGNKLFLSLGGMPLIYALLDRLSHIFDEIVICAGHGEKGAFYESFGAIDFITVIEDRAEGRGPIEGLYCGLSAMRSEWGFLFACDMPSPNEEVIRRMWTMTEGIESDVSAARVDGHVDAVHAFYKITCLPHIQRAILKADGVMPFNLKIKAFYDEVKVNIIEERLLAVVPGYRSSFKGFNTQNELAESFYKN